MLAQEHGNGRAYIAVVPDSDCVLEPGGQIAVVKPWIGAIDQAAVVRVGGLRGFCYGWVIWRIAARVGAGPPMQPFQG